MKIKQLTVLVALLILASCYTVEKPEKPDNLISENNMVNILVDMAIMSSAKGVNKSQIERNGIVPDAFIYKKNNTDSIAFAKSNAYYAFDIKKYDAIFLRVKDSLSVLKNKYKAIEAKEKKEKDSIKKLKKDSKATKKTKFKSLKKAFKGSIN